MSAGQDFRRVHRPQKVSNDGVKDAQVADHSGREIGNDEDTCDV